MIPFRVLRRTDVRPYMTYGLVLINVLVFLWELTIPDTRLYQTFYDIAVVPCQWMTGFFDPRTWLDTVRSMFLHAGVFHLVGNMLYLVLFGPSVEEYFGHWRFLGIYLLTGLFAVFAHVGVRVWFGSDLMCAVGPTVYPPTGGFIPLVGASGAIAGLLGAFLLLYPGTKVAVAIPIPIFRMFSWNTDLASLYVLGYWFALQLFNGVLSIGPSGAQAGGGVAFWAHIGGFTVGLIATFLWLMFKPAPPQRLVEV